MKMYKNNAFALIVRKDEKGDWSIEPSYDAPEIVSYGEDFKGALKAYLSALQISLDRFGEFDNIPKRFHFSYEPIKPVIPTFVSQRGEGVLYNEH